MWNTTPASQIIQIKFNTDNQKKHLLNKSNAKCAIDCKPPHSYHPNQEFKSKLQSKFIFYKNVKIYADNKNLISKVTKIEKSNGELSQQKLNHNRLLEFQSSNMNNRIVRLKNINEENRRLLYRLQNTKSEYSKNVWKAQMEKDAGYRATMQLGKKPRQLDYTDLAEKVLQSQKSIQSQILFRNKSANHTFQSNNQLTGKDQIKQEIN